MLDYVVRGFTRLECGKKIYNDMYFNSIQDFIEPKVLEDYEYKIDLNMPNSNIWQTKLMVKDFPAKRFLMYPEKPVDDSSIEGKMDQLYEEMSEIFHLTQI